MPSYTQYMRQMAVMDADDSEIESWITVKGNHIPIMKGQSKEEAVQAFIEKKGGKTDLTTKKGPKGETLFASKKELKNASLSNLGKDPKGIKPAILESGEKPAKKEPTAAEKHATTRNLLTMFGKHYDDLYEGKTKRNPALVKEFDDKMANDPEFKKQVQAFVRERGDLLTSDREVEAYMLAYNTVKNKLEPANKKLEEYHKKDTETKEPHYFHKWTVESEKPHNLTNEQIQEKLNFYRFVRSNGRSDDNELLDKIHDLSDELERRKK